MSVRIRRLALALACSLVVGGLVEVVALSFTAVVKLVHPRRAHSIVTPTTLGLAYEVANFLSLDGTELKGWFIPGRSGASIVLAHGYGGEKSALLPIARFLNEEGGFSVLLFDFRASGESGGDTFTAGYYEREDLVGAVQYLRGRRDGRSERIGVWGISMGASVAILGAAMTDAIDAVVADSPFQSLSTLLSHSFERIFGLPRFPFQPIAVRLAELRSELPIDAVTSIDEIGKISPRPLMIIHGAEDALIPVSESQDLYRAAGEPKELWVVAGAGHGQAHRLRTGEYEERVTAFFSDHLR